MCTEAIMARSYNAWVSDPNAHRHFSDRFVDHGSAPSIFSNPENMITGPAGTVRLPDVPRHLPPGPAVSGYHGAYGPTSSIPPSAPMSLSTPQYRNAPAFVSTPTQQLMDPARAPHGSAQHTSRAEYYPDMQMSKPPQAGISSHRRLPSLTDPKLQTRIDPGPEYMDARRRISTHSATADARSLNHVATSNAVRQASQIHIPNLLGEHRADAVNNIQFRLKLRQQPKAARSCGFGERDRRVIDPPPIVELVIDGPGLSEDEVRTYRCYESYVMSCSILDESGTRDASYMPEEYRHQRRLMGSLVGTPFVGKDEHGQEGCFFPFADLSCRTPGSFRLKFSVMMIDPTRAGVIRHFPILTEVQSDVFTVYNAKDFPGMVASTQLAHSLKAQGCILQLKKGNDKARGPKGMQDLSDDDLEDFDDDAEMTQGKRKRRSIRQ